MAGKNSHTVSHGMKDMERNRATDILMVANMPLWTLYYAFLRPDNTPRLTLEPCNRVRVSPQVCVSPYAESWVHMWELGEFL